jgi:WD40 repeat protein/tRNA A-37 threonylcarbamoyl transferase component Bud32
VRSLGAGGMGEVWLAERADADFRQRVALKLVKRGMDTEMVLQRFRRERKVLAQLTHPNIPSLIDGGASADGRPYLVMEHVDGVALDAFVRERALDVPARLRLFLKIGEAVQHAHERGVVHRDLKPSNVLVTSAGEPKLLDFGISKVLDAHEDSNTLELTLTGQQMLTPRYASPEQVRGGEVTASTDVYALGLMLWELLVGKPAVSFDGLTQADFAETICERDVPRPSLAVETNATSLRRAIAGDLDTICAMALRKEPERRYASVKQLCEDVQRHLDAQPVLARADTMTYRVSKFVRRNRVLVGATFGIMLALAVGLVIAMVMFFRSEDARYLAERRLEDSTYFAYQSAIRGAYAALQVGVALPDMSAQPLELRGWEWKHLTARNDCTTRTLWRTPGTSPLALDGNGTTLAVTEGADVVLVDLESGEERRRVGVFEPAYKIALSPDGERLAAVASNRLRLYDTSTGEMLWFHEAPRGFECLVFTRDGLHLLGGHKGNAIRAYPIECPEFGFELASMNGYVRDLAFSRDGSLVAACAGADDVRVFRWDTGELVRRLTRTDEPLRMLGVALSASGRYVACVDDNGRVAAWDLETGQALSLPPNNSQACFTLGMRSDRDELVVPGNHLRIWDFDSGASRTLPGSQSTIRRMVMHPVKPLAYTSCQDGRVLEWDVSSAQVPSHFVGRYADAIALSPDGARYVVRHTSGSRLDRVDAASGAIVATHRAESKLSRALAYTADGSSVVAADAQGLMFLDGDTLALEKRVAVKQAGAFTVATPTQTAFVDSGGESIVRVDLSSAQVLGAVPAPFASIHVLACDSEGEWIAAGRKESAGVAVARWGSSEWRTLGEEGAGGTSSLAISPDGQWLAAGGDTVRVFSIASGSRVFEHQGGARYAMFFTRDGTRLIASTSGRLDVVNTQRWSVVTSLMDNVRGITALAYDPRTENVYACDYSGVVRHYRAVEAPRIDAVQH